jgi:L-fuconolactonase
VTTALADAHLHLFREGFPGRYGKGPYGLGQEVEAYEHFRQKHSIQVGLVVGFQGSGVEQDNNLYIRHLAATRPWLATVAYVEPSEWPEPDAIEALMSQGHVGISIYLREAKAASAVLAWPRNSWQHLNERQAIISLNAVPEATGELASLIEANDRCRFLFSHLGLPGRYSIAPSQVEIRERLAPLLSVASCPNAMVKISGLYAISDPPHAYPHETAWPIIDAVLDRFGTQRCCWGSDFSPSLDFLSFAQTVSIPGLNRLHSADRERIMGGNLLQLLKS